jgi:hypothetical protein
MMRLLPALALLLAIPLVLPPSPAFAASPLPLPGDKPIENFPDSAVLRRGLFDSFLNASRKAALALPEQRLDAGDRKWKRLTAVAGEAFYLILAAEGDGSFPLHAQGSWIVKRSSADGRFLQAKVFLKSDPGTFLRIYPYDRGRSHLDLVAYGAVLNREVPLPLPFERVLTSSMADIVAWTRDSVDWSLFSPHPGQYAELRGLAATIRERLPALAYAEDGGLDEAGRPVFIATGKPQTQNPGLNCSGFAQWVIDGLLKPRTGSWIGSAALKERLIDLRGSSFTDPYEELLDPWFGLDWVRRLGKAWADARSPARSHGILENDVSLEPFALLAGQVPDPVNGGASYVDYPSRGPDTGYEVAGLPGLLFVLASRNPGDFYLASLSKPDPKTGIRRHYHVALLFPWFDEESIFHVSVFESAAEGDFSAFIARHRGETAFLVRAPAASRFDPPSFR